MRSVTCSSCGLVCWADGGNCKRCGQPLVLNSNPLNVPPPREAPPQQNPQQPTQNFHAAPNSYGPPPKQRKGYAAASLAVGVVGLLSFGILLVGSVVGTILGMVALKKVSSDPARYGGRGLAIGGITLNILSMLTIIPLALIASIAIPNLLAARRAANEASAIYSMRRIMSAEQSYLEMTGENGFGGMSQLAAAGLVDERLKTGMLNGYRFVVTANGGGFEAHATPLDYGSSGMRSFYVSSEDGEIHVGLNNGLPATANDPTLDSFDTSNSFDRPSSPARRVSQPPLRRPATLPAR